MRNDDARREALQVLKNWLRRVSHADIEPVEDGRPSPAARRLERTFETLKSAVCEDRVFLAEADSEVRSSVGPMMVLLDRSGGVILGVAPPPRSEAYPAALRRRFTWP